MKINVLKAKNEIGCLQTFNFVTSADDLDLNDAQVGVNHPISISGTVLNSDRGLDVSGTIETVMEYQCDRCLEKYAKEVKISFAENFQESDTSSAEHPDSSCFEGNEIELGELIRENILLVQPLKKLCSEECKGLCPQCGTNLNIAKCSCERESIDPRLAALQQFLHK